MSQVQLDWQPCETDPPADAVKHVTFVLFFPDGTCGLPEDATGLLTLPAGGVLPGEHWLLDACLRIPLMTAGFRMQRAHPFARSRTSLFVWLEGDRYTGNRPHADVDLTIADAEEIVGRLRAEAQPRTAELVSAAARSYRQQEEESYYGDTVRLLEPAYLRADTVEGGSGFGSGAEDWHAAREPIIDGIPHDGSLLDVGCANGLLMESVQRWCAERGLRIEPHGVDLAPGLVELARRRLPHWADRIWLGNALDWVPLDGLRFDYVHTLLDCVPPAAWRRLIEHHRKNLARPGGRLLVSYYVAAGSRAPSAAQVLAELGYRVAGESRLQTNRPGAPPQTAWLDVAK